jgi:hypothetical protein
MSNTNHQITWGELMYTPSIIRSWSYLTDQLHCNIYSINGPWSYVGFIILHVAKLHSPDQISESLFIYTVKFV